jgi:hypothetical protein
MLRRCLVLIALVVALTPLAAPAGARAADPCPRVVVYAASEWVRVGSQLGAYLPSCAQVYISIPPLTDKTRPRPDQARRIRALGSNFHALAEINVTAWTAWVRANGVSWFDAGVEARRRMAAAGFDLSLGDTWALNELASAVRVGANASRANMREFIRGLYTGPDGVGVKGVVFVVGIGQATTELSVYQARLQDWYEDVGFWTDMAAYVSDWSQEVYGDVRTYAALGVDSATRRARLVEYLHHQLLLARAAPPSADAARAFLTAASTPVANAAWLWEKDFGWTNVGDDGMADFVAAQVDALRSVGPRVGVAWAPRNLHGVPVAEFRAQTDAILDRLAAALADPNGGCTVTGCSALLEGAAPTPRWATFARWRPSQLAIVSAPASLQPGVPSPPVTVQLRTATGLPYTTGLPLPVTLTTTSPTGAFAPAPEGPWTPTLTVTIPSGASSVTFHYLDAAAAPVTASAPGKLPATATIGTIPPPDTTPPDTTIERAPAPLERSTRAVLSFASEPDARFECSLDGARFATCPATVRYRRLVQGRHVLAVRAIDAAGNVDRSPARVGWVVDTVPPVTRIVPKPRLRVWFAARGERGATYRCSLDGRPFASCRSPYRLPTLAPGRHVFHVRATDAAGNREKRTKTLIWRLGP